MFTKAYMTLPCDITGKTIIPGDTMWLPKRQGYSAVIVKRKVVAIHGDGTIETEGMPGWEAKRAKTLYPERGYVIR